MYKFTQQEIDTIQDTVKHINILIGDFKEIRACYINDIGVQPLCPVCGKNCKYFKKSPTLYTTFCSNECKKTDKGKEIILLSINNTLAERYGVTNPSQMVGHMDKVKATNIEKFGVPCVWKNEKIRTQVKTTLKERYGVTNPSQIEGHMDKVRATSLKKFGVEHYSKTNEFSDSVKTTNNEKYEKDYYMQTDEFKIRLKLTKRETYYDIFMALLKAKNIIPQFSYEEYLKYDYDIGDKEYKCLRCNKIFYSINLKVQKVCCPNHKYSSIAEQEIRDWLESEISDIKIEPNKRFYYDGYHFKECDIYLPDYGLGVEYHGLYWHSEMNTDKDSNKHKYEIFKSKDIEIIQIFESEWTHSENIVKSLIRSRLKLTTNKIYARKCSIELVPNNDYKIFCELNHLQGYGTAKIRLGLYYNNELVQIMSFSKPRYNKKYDWENIRTCSVLNTIVVGGFSKLLSYFINNYEGSIISYVDARLFNGSGYIANGFEYLYHSNCNYKYYKENSNILESRIKYQKHKLSGILPFFDSSLSEHSNMLNNDYYRVYDAGNLVLGYSK